MTDDYRMKAKLFLKKYFKTNEKKIAKMKRNRKIVRSLFIGIIILLITSSTVCAASVGIIPFLAITILSSAGGLGTAISVKFNLKNKKEKLNQSIDELENVKHKIDYIVSCNGDFTEAEFKEILREFIMR